MTAATLANPSWKTPDGPAISVAPEGFNAVVCTADPLVGPLGNTHSFNAVLGQLARWFYPFGSGAHCNNYYY